MGFVYKDHDLDEWIAQLKSFMFTSVNYKTISPATSQTVRRFFRNEGYPELATLIMLAMDKWVDQDFVNKAEELEEGETMSGDFGDVVSFAAENAALISAGISFPPLGAVIAAFKIVTGLMGLFSTEARDASFNTKEETHKRIKVLENLGSGGDRWMQHLFSVPLWAWNKSRPKCRTASEACSKEHLRYVDKVTVMFETQDSLFEIMSTYLNEANFKEFVDTYDLIKLQMGVTVTSVSGTGSGTTQTGGAGGGCLGLLIGIVSVFSAIGYGVFTLLS